MYDSICDSNVQFLSHMWSFMFQFHIEAEKHRQHSYMTETGFQLCASHMCIDMSLQISSDTTSAERSYSKQLTRYCSRWHFFCCCYFWFHNGIKMLKGSNQMCISWWSLYPMSYPYPQIHILFFFQWISQIFPTADQLWLLVWWLTTNRQLNC